MAYGDLRTLISRCAETARAEEHLGSAEGKSVAADVQGHGATPPPTPARGGRNAHVWCEVICMILAVVVLGLLMLNLLKQLI